MKTLFISYNGALEPLMQSQGIAYLKGLTKKGVQCYLLSFEKPLSDKDSFKARIAGLRKELKSSGITWYWLKYHKRPTVPATFYDICGGLILSFWLVISKKIDILHARASVAALIGYTIAKLTGKKFLFDERGLMAEEYADGGIWPRSSMLYKITLHIEKYMLSRADAVVVLTESIKRFLTKNKYLHRTSEDMERMLSVIPCCVDTERFTKKDTGALTIRQKLGFSGKFIFLYVGSLGTWYLLDEMIDFFSSAKTIIKNAHFFVVTHTGRTIVENSWQRKGMPFTDITITESSFEQIPQCIQAADVGMFFIKPVFSKIASSPTKFAEYLACGLPVIINARIGDTAGFVEKYRLGAVVNEFSEKAYIHTVHCLLELQNDKHLLADRCSGIAQQFFSLNSGVASYLKIYNALA